MPDRFDSKSEFMLEILRVFDHETARSKNSSFRYFMQKYTQQTNNRQDRPPFTPTQLYRRTK